MPHVPLNLSHKKYCVVRCRKAFCMAENEACRSHSAQPAALENVRIVVENGFISEIGVAGRHYDSSVSIVDYGDTILLPALINAHAHLQLGWLHGHVNMDEGFTPWLKSMVPHILGRKKTGFLENCQDLLDGLEKGLRDLAACGTGWVGDIGASLPGSPMAVNKATSQKNIGVIHFCEWIGFGKYENGPWPGICRPELVNAPFWQHAAPAGHALYSTSPEILRGAKKWCQSNGRVFSLHLAESVEESEMLLHGAGGLHDYYREFVLPEDWQAPRMKAAQMAKKLDLLDNATLAVHCVQVDSEDIATLAESGASVCLCPRSNRKLVVGAAPAQKLLDAGINVCLGTDGLSSNDDLDLRNEALDLIERQGISPFAAMRMLTVNGARALGIDRLAGSLRPGRKAAFSIFEEEFF